MKKRIIKIVPVPVDLFKDSQCIFERGMGCVAPKAENHFCGLLNMSGNQCKFLEVTPEFIKETEATGRSVEDEHFKAMTREILEIIDDDGDTHYLGMPKEPVFQAPAQN